MYKLAFGILLVMTATAHAGIVFSDNFDGENGGANQLNYDSFANWTVSDGSVDLIGNAPWDWFGVSNGLYVDMDGTTGSAGKMTATLVNLQPGEYQLSFELAGNQRNGSSESVNVEVTAGAFSDTISLSQNAPFQLFTRNFTVSTAGDVDLSFAGVGGDNVGMLLDNVSVSIIPVPGAVLLGSLGMATAGILRRRIG